MPGPLSAFSLEAIFTLSFSYLLSLLWAFYLNKVSFAYLCAIISVHWIRSQEPENAGPRPWPLVMMDLSVLPKSASSSWVQGIELLLPHLLELLGLHIGAATSYSAGWAVLAGVSIVVIKHCDQKQLEQERVYFPYISTSQSITQGSWGRNLEAGLMQKPRRNAACWLGPPVWAYHLAYTGLSTHCAVGSGGVCHPLGRWSWAVWESRVNKSWPINPLINKLPHKLAHRLIWWGHFLNWDSVFPNHSCLYQVDKNKQASQHLGSLI